MYTPFMRKCQYWNKMDVVKLIKTKIQNGLVMWYREDDKFVGQRIALRKYEEYESILILKNVNKNSVVVDIGANIGYYTLLLAKVCKRVYTIEPDKECFEILKKNILENNLKNVVLINKAVSDRKEKLNFIVDKENLGNSRIKSQRDSLIKEQTHGSVPTGLDVVLCDRLDNILKKERVDLIKIDTQGWEPKVILGARRVIKKYKPILFLEFNGDYKMIKFLKKYYKNIFTIDYWFYILKKGIKIDEKIGYADLFSTNKNMVWWERYKNLQWKKGIKCIIGV